jgi:hypothetical protein
MPRRALRQAERSALYGAIVTPPPPPPIVLAEARGPKAQTALEREGREARRTTTPAPKARRRGPRGRFDQVEIATPDARE